jgi:hypothetical protein
VLVLVAALKRSISDAEDEDDLRELFTMARCAWLKNCCRQLRDKIIAMKIAAVRIPPAIASAMRMDLWRGDIFEGS